MRAVVRIAPAVGDDPMIMPVTVVRTATEARRDRGKIGLGRQPRGFGEQPLRVAAQGGTGVHAVPLERHPVRPDIAFLQHVGAYPTRSGHAVRGYVIGSAIAEQDEVGNAFAAHERVEERRPVRHAPAIVDRAIAPVAPVAPAQVYAVHRDAARAQCVSQPVKQWTRRPLQERK